MATRKKTSRPRGKGRAKRTSHRPSTSAGPSSGKKRRRRTKYEFNFPTTVPQNMQNVKFHHYIKKVQKKVKPRIKMTGQTLHLMDMILKDTLHHIATEAKSRMGRRKTLKPPIITRALKKIMPKNLVLKAHEHGQKALERFLAAKSKRRK